MAIGAEKTKTLRGLECPQKLGRVDVTEVPRDGADSQVESCKGVNCSGVKVKCRGERWR